MRLPEPHPTCQRCGRPLKNPHSVELGLGPTCAKKVYAERQVTMDLSAYVSKKAV